MPDKYGFKTIRELELELEVERLQRQLLVLQGVLDDREPLYVREAEAIVLPDIHPRMQCPMTALTTLAPDDRRAMYRIEGEAYLKDGTYKMAEWVSESMLCSHYDPMEAMMRLYQKMLMHLARTRGKR